MFIIQVGSCIVVAAFFGEWVVWRISGGGVFSAVLLCFASYLPPLPFLLLLPPPITHRQLLPRRVVVRWLLWSSYRLSDLSHVYIYVFTLRMSEQSRTSSAFYCYLLRVCASLSALYHSLVKYMFLSTSSFFSLFQVRFCFLFYIIMVSKIIHSALDCEKINVQ